MSPSVVYTTQTHKNKQRNKKKKKKKKKYTDKKQISVQWVFS